MKRLFGRRLRMGTRSAHLGQVNSVCSGMYSALQNVQRVDSGGGGSAGATGAASLMKVGKLRSMTGRANELLPLLLFGESLDEDRLASNESSDEPFDEPLDDLELLFESLPLFDPDARATSTPTMTTIPSVRNTIHAVSLMARSVSYNS